MRSNFNKISSDVIRTIALRMNFREILAFCKTNSKFNNAICMNNRFWMDKVNQDYGKYGHIPELFHKNGIDINNIDWKYYYHVLNRIDNIKIERTTFHSRKMGISEHFQKAIKMRHIETLNILLDDVRVDPTTSGNFAILWSSEHGYHDIVNLLLKDGRADPSAQNNASIIVATMKGYLEVVRLLLNDPRVDPSAQNNMAIAMASEKGYLEIAKLLLNNPKVDPSMLNSLGRAILHGNDKIVKLLLEGKSDPTRNGNENIIVASKYGFYNIVKLLLEDGRADPSAKDNDSIKWAKYNKHYNIVKLLSEDKRVDPSAEFKGFFSYFY